MTNVNKYFADNDTISAVKMLEAMGEDGDTAAYNRLGRMYDKGDTLTYNADKSLHYYYLSAKLGNPYAQYKYGKDAAYINANNRAKFDESIGFLEKSAKQGYKDAMYEIGMILTGQRFSTGFKDYNKAAVYFQKAADKGITESYYELGMIYSGLRDSTYKNLTKAFAFFKTGADKGNPGCFEKTGLSYEQGLGTKVDGQKAIYYLEKAANIGNKDCMFEIYDIYSRGKIVPKNPVAASNWLVKAGDAGSALALYLLEAKAWASNDFESEKHWGALLSDNSDAPPSMRGEAQLHLGILYATGFNHTEECNYDEAESYLEDAVNNGYDIAVKALADVREAKRLQDEDY